MSSLALVVVVSQFAVLGDEVLDVEFALLVLSLELLALFVQGLSVFLDHLENGGARDGLLLGLVLRVQFFQLLQLFLVLVVQLVVGAEVLRELALGLNDLLSQLLGLLDALVVEVLELDHGPVAQPEVSQRVRVNLHVVDLHVAENKKVMTKRNVYLLHGRELALHFSTNVFVLALEFGQLLLVLERHEFEWFLCLLCGLGFFLDADLVGLLSCALLVVLGSVCSLVLLHLGQHLLRHRGFAVEPTVDVSDYCQKVGATVVEVPGVEHLSPDHPSHRVDVLVHHSAHNH